MATKASKLQIPSKSVVARASFVRQSPRKLRLVADAVRGMDPIDASNYLKVLPQRAAKTLLKVFQQGIGNAKNNFKAPMGKMKVKTLQIEEGPRGPKRADVHAHGARFNRGIRRKRMAHIKLILSYDETPEK